MATLVLSASFYGVYDIYFTNRPLLVTNARFQNRQEIASALRLLDPGVFLISDPTFPADRVSTPPQAVPLEYYTFGIKRLDATWEYTFNHDVPKNQPPNPPLEVKPKYVIASTTTRAPAGATIAVAAGDLTAYQLPGSPYYASTFSSAALPGEGWPPAVRENWVDRTRPASAEIVSANVITVRANTRPEEDHLLLLESYRPGWRLQIDGKDAARPDNYSGYLSAKTQPGQHTYTFVFDPASVRYGAAITIGALLGALLLTGEDMVRRVARSAVPKGSPS